MFLLVSSTMSAVLDERVGDYLDVYANCLTRPDLEAPMEFCPGLSLKILEDGNLTSRQQRLEELMLMDKRRAYDYNLLAVPSPIAPEHLPGVRGSYGNFKISYGTCMTNLPTGMISPALLPATCALKAKHVADLNLSERDTITCTFYYVFPPFFSPSYEQMVEHCLKIFTPVSS